MFLVCRLVCTPDTHAQSTKPEFEFPLGPDANRFHIWLSAYTPMPNQPQLSSELDALSHTAMVRAVLPVTAHDVPMLTRRVPSNVSRPSILHSAALPVAGWGSKGR